MDINYMTTVVQDYIYHRKDKVVKISIRDQRDVMLLLKAYNYAMNWFNVNKI